MASGPNIGERVSVLETGFKDLKSTVENGRVETRQGFVEVTQTLNQVRTDVAALAGRARPTNWVGIAAAVAAVVGVMGAFFTLAEWRVSVTADPFAKTIELQRRTIDKLAEQIIELRVEHGVMKDRLRRVAPEQSQVTAR